MAAPEHPNQRWDRLLIGTSYGYLVLPILIFLFGWLRTPIAVFVTVLVLFGAWKAVAGFGYPELRNGFRPGFIFLCLLVSAAWVLLSGIDRFGFQNWDFNVRNAVFRDLVREPWPVLYDYRPFPGMQARFGTTGALVYYLAFWLPSAILGKALGWEAANHALLIWTILGVLLTALLLCRFSGVKSPLIVVAFALWSGLDIVGSLLYQPPAALTAGLAGGAFHWRSIAGEILARVLGSEHLEGWVFDSARTYLWQYSSFSTQLFWVFNQSVPAWIATALLLNQRDRKSLIYTYSLTILLAPFPAIGLLPFLVYRLLEGFKLMAGTAASRIVKDLWEHIASVQNLVPPLILGFIVASYFATQRNPVVQGFVWESLPISVDTVARYVAFCLLEFGLVGFLILRQKQHAGLVTVALVVLLLLPVYRYGPESELCLRASIPPLMVLFMVGIRSVFAPPPAEFGPRLYRTLLIAALLVGSITPLHEITRSTSAIVETMGAPAATDTWITLNGRYSRRPPDIGHLVASQADQTFFFRFLARHN